jgi:VanZ family protein
VPAHASPDRRECLTSPSDRSLSRSGRRLFIAYLVVILVIFMMPVPETPLGESRHLDKLTHFAAFLGFAVVYYQTRRTTVGRTFVISCAFAAGVELLQGALPYRDSEWWDFVTGAVGSAVGAVLVFLLKGRAASAIPNP